MQAAARPSDFKDKARGSSDGEGAELGFTSLSPGERGANDGAFSTRGWTDEGFPPVASHIVRQMLCTSYSTPCPPGSSVEGQTERGAESNHASKWVSFLNSRYRFSISWGVS